MTRRSLFYLCAVLVIFVGKSQAMEEFMGFGLIPPENHIDNLIHLENIAKTEELHRKIFGVNIPDAVSRFSKICDNLTMTLRSSEFELMNYKRRVGANKFDVTRCFLNEVFAILNNAELTPENIKNIVIKVTNMTALLISKQLINQHIPESHYSDRITPLYLAVILGLSKSPMKSKDSVVRQMLCAGLRFDPEGLAAPENKSAPFFSSEFHNFEEAIRLVQEFESY